MRKYLKRDAKFCNLALGIDLNDSVTLDDIAKYEPFQTSASMSEALVTTTSLFSRASRLYSNIESTSNDFPQLDTLPKGYFPHLFTIVENLNYGGFIPAIEFHTPDHMKANACSDFLQWYSER